MLVIYSKQSDLLTVQVTNVRSCRASMKTTVQVGPKKRVEITAMIAL